MSVICQFRIRHILRGDDWSARRPARNLRQVAFVQAVFASFQREVPPGLAKSHLCATASDDAFSQIGQLTHQLDSAREGIAKLMFPGDANALADIQWVLFAFAGIACFSILDTLRRLVESVLTMSEIESATGGESRAAGAWMDAIPPAPELTDEKRREFEITLMRAEKDAEVERSVTFLFGACILFWYANEAFFRSPGTPLQP